MQEKADILAAFASAAFNQIARTSTGDEVNTEGRAVRQAMDSMPPKLVGKNVIVASFYLAKKNC